jgi:predicted TIM-barrel fold metal-dependent hydrolase
MTSRAAADIRAELDHPVVDGDGHAIEVAPVLLDYIDRVGGPAMVDRYKRAPMKRQYRLTDDENYWTKDSGSWVWPTRNTLDRATATLPKLYAERLDEFGIDFAIVYPSDGLSAPQFAEDDLRQACCRAYNLYISESYAPFADRMTPAAVIPCNTPDEAVSELRYACGELGMKAAVLRSYVKRPATADSPERLDFLALGSDYDYDPVWAACRDLGVAATFHTSAVYGGRSQIPNYSYNHIGILAAGGEAICKALFMGGVTRRFPGLNFAFLEGGVGWGVNLFSDLIGHWNRRSAAHIGDYDPANLDLDLYMRLMEEYGDDRVRGRLDDIRAIFARPQPEVEQADNFEAVGMESIEEILDLFVAPFWFGCEADDPVTATAFNRQVNPFGASLKAILGSDNAHWDVPDMRDVLGEAFEMVEDGKLSAADFRDFCFTNPVQLHAGMNPNFFKGTRVEKAVDGLLGVTASA